MEQATCARCGSTNVRRARHKTIWKRLYSAVTGEARYACQACHHRGWTVGALAAYEARTPRPGRVAPGRPLEDRDIRASREARFRTTGLVLAAVAVGGSLAATLAWLLG
ncbi:MAG: hypothetical protein IPO09_00045 [Anaeromyxobacter sp.]|nr:hypothetical protein [Anaeromyxobacter sp.]MBL0278439.1 hypothetical protein [Anaeromyxobacter sp.]